MDEKKLNDNEKTMVFNPIKEKNKKETPEESPVSENNFPFRPEETDDFIEELVNEDYDEDDYEDDDYEDDEISNRTKIILITVTALATIVFVVTCIWGISTFISTKKEKPEVPPKEDIVVESEKIEETPEEEPIEEEKNIVYNIAFLPDSVEKEGDSYTVRAKLYNKSMVSEGEKRIVLNDSTEIVEDGEELSLVSFISIIESIEDEEIIFKGKISEKTREVINISYSSEILKELQPTEPEPEIEEEISEEAENGSEELPEDSPPENENEGVALD